MFIYAVRDRKTGKLVTNITNPGHKFWEKKSYCEQAIDNYYYSSANRYLRQRTNYDLELVTFNLVEVSNEQDNT